MRSGVRSPLAPNNARQTGEGYADCAGAGRSAVGSVGGSLVVGIFSVQSFAFA